MLVTIVGIQCCESWNTHTWMYFKEKTCHNLEVCFWNLVEKVWIGDFSLLFKPLLRDSKEEITILLYHNIVHWTKFLINISVENMQENSTRNDCSTHHIMTVWKKLKIEKKYSLSGIMWDEVIIWIVRIKMVVALQVTSMTLYDVLLSSYHVTTPCLHILEYTLESQLYHLSLLCTKASCGFI